MAKWLNGEKAKCLNALSGAILFSFLFSLSFFLSFLFFLFLYSPFKPPGYVVSIAQTKAHHFVEWKAFSAFVVPTDFELVNTVFNEWAFRVTANEVRIVGHRLSDEDRVTFSNVFEVVFTARLDSGNVT